jgi:hypothetical protein
MEAVLDTGFSLSYRDQVLQFLFPLFPRPTSRDGSLHVHALTRLLVTLSSSSLTVPLFTSLVPKEKLLAYQFAFDLAEGGSQDFLESVRTELPEGDAVNISVRMLAPTNYAFPRIRKRYMTDSGVSFLARNLSNCISNSSSATTTQIS